VLTLLARSMARKEKRCAYKGRWRLSPASVMPDRWGMRSRRRLRARERSSRSALARSASRVNARAEELRTQGASVIAIPADLTTEEGAQALAQETLAANGRINF
jgi:hypothetical protein